MFEGLVFTGGVAMVLFDSPSAQSPPNPHLDLLLLVNLLQDQTHGVEENDSTDEGEYLND